MVDHSAVPSDNPPSIPAGGYEAVPMVTMVDDLVLAAATLHIGVERYLSDTAASRQAEALAQTLQDIRRRLGA